MSFIGGLGADVSVKSMIDASIGTYRDGINDDYATLQANVNATPARALIGFQPGVYVLSRPLALPGGRAYVGLGSGETGAGVTFTQANGTNLYCLAASYEHLNAQNYASAPTYVSNINFDGNSANNTTGHGLIIQGYRSKVQDCSFYNIPQTAIIIADRTQSGANVTNTIVENRIVRPKISGTGQYGIWVQNLAGFTNTDGRVSEGEISGTALDGIRLDRGAGWFLKDNHLYGCLGAGINAFNCWSTFIIGNEIDFFIQNAAATGFIGGISASLIGPRPTLIANNIISSTEPASGAHYQYLTVTGAGSTTTVAQITGNFIRGGYINTTTTQAVASTGVASITVANSDGLFVGCQVLCDTAGNQETITISAINNLTITANFARTHSTGAFIGSLLPNTGYSIGMTIQTNATQNTSGFPFNAFVEGNRVDGCGQVQFIDANTKLIPIEEYGDVQLDRHLIASTAVNAAPVLAALTNNGTSPPATTFSSLGGTDTRGKVNFGTGGAPAAGDQVSVIFNKAFTGIPVIVLQATNAATAALIPYVSSPSTTAFTIAFTNAPTASQASGTYSVAFMVIG